MKYKYCDLPKELKKDWNNLNIEEVEKKWRKSSRDITGYKRFLDRPTVLLEAWKRVHSVLSEYTTHDYGNKKIIDISSGTGTMLEVMKYYNHEVMGVDYTHSQNDYIYQDFLISQNIPYIIHDCSKLPYPFEDKQFDVLINWGAFHFYKPMDNWVNIIKEFMRITKETIIVLVNHGPLLEKGRHYFMQQFDGWKLNKNDDNFYKWTDNFFKWTKE